jgi:hypothetical protein
MEKETHLVRWRRTNLSVLAHRTCKFHSTPILVHYASWQSMQFESCQHVTWRNHWPTKHVLQEAPWSPEGRHICFRLLHGNWSMLHAYTNYEKELSFRRSYVKSVNASAANQSIICGTPLVIWNSPALPLTREDIDSLNTSWCGNQLQ